MTRELTAALVLLLLLVFIGLMAVGWLRRRRRQAPLGSLTAVPATTGEPLLRVDVLYVATTKAGEPYERIAAAGLGFRSRALVTVVPEGVVLGIAGRPDGFVPSAEIRGADRATWTIDRVVEKDGLVLLGWTLAGQDVDSYFRADDPAALTAAFRAVAAPASSSPNSDRETA